MFGEHKNKLYSLPMLKFPEFDKPFKVHIKANDVDIGEVLMKDGWPWHFKWLSKETTNS